MGYSYDYGYGYAGPDEAVMEEMMTGFGMVFAGMFAVIALIALAVVVTTYVCRSLGLYSIAKRRGIRGAWMVWLPVLRDWIIGSISDQYQYVVKGKVKSKRVLLLVLSVACMVLGLVGQVVGVVSGVLGGTEEAAVAGFTFSAVLMLAGVVLNIAYAVFYYIAMYDLYTSCSPQNNVMFLVLGIIFRVTEPFFIFFNRKKDDGMPPRRETHAAPVLQEPAPREDWEAPDYL